MGGFTDLEKNHIYFLVNGQLQKRVYDMHSFLKTYTHVDDTLVSVEIYSPRTSKQGQCLLTPKIMCIFMESFHICLLSTYVHKAF